MAEMLGGNSCEGWLLAVLSIHPYSRWFAVESWEEYKGIDDENLGWPRSDDQQGEAQTVIERLLGEGKLKEVPHEDRTRLELA